MPLMDTMTILNRMVVRVWMKLQRELVNDQIDWHRVIERNRNGPVLHLDDDIVFLRGNSQILCLFQNIVLNVVLDSSWGSR